MSFIWLNKLLQCYGINLTHLFHNMKSLKVTIKVWKSNSCIKFLKEIFLHLSRHKIDDTARSGLEYNLNSVSLPDIFVNIRFCANGSMMISNLELTKNTWHFSCHPNYSLQIVTPGHVLLWRPYQRFFVIFQRFSHSLNSRLWNILGHVWVLFPPKLPEKGWKDKWHIIN